LIGPLPELLLEELDELELLEELELLLEELELLLELLDELDELEDEPVSTGGGVPPPPHAVSRDAQSSKVNGGVEIAGFKKIDFIKAPKAIFVL
jgi:hypothetical protein